MALPASRRLLRNPGGNPYHDAVSRVVQRHTYYYHSRRLKIAGQQIVSRSTRNEQSPAKLLTPLGLTEGQNGELQDYLKINGATHIDISESLAILLSYASSPALARQLVLAHPRLLCCQLPSWVHFLEAFGLNKSQVQHVLWQTPEVLVQGDLVAAGRAILTFKRLGLSNEDAVKLVAYLPQLLCMEEEQIATTIRILGKFQTGAF